MLFINLAYLHTIWVNMKLITQTGVSNLKYSKFKVTK